MINIFKNKIFWGVACFVVFLVTFSVFNYIKDSKNKETFNSTIALLVEDGYIKDSDLKECLDDYKNKDCLFSIKNYFIEGSKIQLQLVSNFSEKDHQMVADELVNSIKNESIADFKTGVEIGLENTNNKIALYLNNNRDVISTLGKEINKNHNSELSNLFIDNNWAVATINNEGENVASILLQKQDTKWVEIMGPGTSFDQVDYKKAGAPEKIFEKLTKIYETPVIRYESPDFKGGVYLAFYIDDQLQQEPLPKADRLPIYKESYTILIDYTNSRSTYCAIIYYESVEQQEKIKKEVDSWFRLNNIDINKYPVVYKYYELSSSDNYLE